VKILGQMTMFGEDDNNPSSHKAQFINLILNRFEQNTIIYVIRQFRLQKREIEFLVNEKNFI
jgi:hypothetical protein